MLDSCCCITAIRSATSDEDMVKSSSDDEDMFIDRLLMVKMILITEVLCGGDQGWQ